MVNYYENITNDRVNMTNWNFFFWTSSSEELKEGKTAKREKNDIISYEIYTSQCN